MSRGLSSPVATGIAQTVVPIAFFAEFSFASGALRMWSGYGDKLWNAVNWTGSGELGGISPVDETSEIGASGLTFTLSGVPNALRAIALADAYRGRPCKAWLAILNDAGAVLGAYQFYAGRMDVMPMKAAMVGATSAISIQSENRLVDLYRPRSSRWTNAEQQRLSPGDTSCSRIGKLAERPLPWGVPTADSAAAAAPSYNSAFKPSVRI
jgi:hypothetical protein